MRAVNAQLHRQLGWIGIIQESRVCACLWGFPQRGLTHEGRFNLNLHGTISWSGVLVWIKKRKKGRSQRLLAVIALLSGWGCSVTSCFKLPSSFLPQWRTACLLKSRITNQNQNLPLKSCFCQVFCHSNEETIKYSHRYTHTDRYSSPFPVPVEANSNPYLTATDTVELGFAGLPLIYHAMGNPS